MRKILLTLSAALQLTLIVVGTVVIAFLVSISINLLFAPPRLSANLDLVTSVYQVLGTLYAVLLAFAVSGVWQNFSKAVLSVQTEANAISDLVHMVEYSAIEKTLIVRDLALDYLRLVVEKEWELLGQIIPDKLNAWEISREASTKITHKVLTMNPVSNIELVVYGQILTLLNAWLDARRTRILIAKGNSAKALWPLLIFGALVLFGFHGLFVIKAFEVWTILLLALSLIIGLAFFLIFTLDCPFIGKPFVDFGPFQWTIQWLENEQFLQINKENYARSL